LSDRISARIKADGPITFAEFMEAALYDPEEGFYERTPVGKEGGFVTAPHLSGAFGALVARQVADFWTLLGGPAPMDVVEAGAGDGALGRQVLASLQRPLRDAVRYTAVERVARARASIESQPDGIAAVVRAMGKVPRGLTGCVLANELLDNLPFHLVRGTERGLVELLVGFEDGRFELVEGPAPSAEVERLAPALRPGQDAAVSPAAVSFVDRATGLLSRGYVWICDYGHGPGEAPGPVHGYRDHRLEADVLADPGSRDITAGVDFGALIRRAEDLGHRWWGPVRERDALLALGFREWNDRARRLQGEALAAGRGLEAARIYSSRNRASMLVDPAHLGDFKVLCIGVGMARPPASVARGALS
jgi:SAM-dependent MidA family methyltransferase